MVDEKIEVTEAQVEAVNKEVEAKTEEKIDAVKKEVAAEVKKSNDEFKAELAKLREENERRELEQQIAIEREKARVAAQAPIQKHTVPEASNPTQVKSEIPVRTLSQQEEWLAFEQASKEGNFQADIRDIAKLPKQN